MRGYGNDYRGAFPRPGSRYDIDDYRYPAGRGMRRYPGTGGAGYGVDFRAAGHGAMPPLYSGEFENGYGSYAGGGYDRGFMRGGPGFGRGAAYGAEYGPGRRSGGYGREYRGGGYDRGWGRAFRSR